MDPNACISGLDRALAAGGENVTVRRSVAGGVDIPCRAFCLPTSGHGPGGLTENAVDVVLSPTDLNLWPAGAPVQQGDPVLPQRLDKILIAGRWHTIQVVSQRYVQGVLVRVEARAVG